VKIRDSSSLIMFNIRSVSCVDCSESSEVVTLLIFMWSCVSMYGTNFAHTCCTDTPFRMI
jgi:hypothetical protein